MIYPAGPGTALQGPAEATEEHKANVKRKMEEMIGLQSVLLEGMVIEESWQWPLEEVQQQQQPIKVSTERVSPSVGASASGRPSPMVSAIEATEARHTQISEAVPAKVMPRTLGAQLWTNKQDMERMHTVGDHG